MSASARAEARRKAILSRGSDRLAKLTTSARGDDPVYNKHDGPPSPNLPSASRNFVGEETAMPTPPSPKRPSLSPRNMTSPENSNLTSQASRSSNVVPDPSVWSEQQQQQFLQALMAASPLSRSPESLPGLTPTDVDPTLPPMDNPLAAMLFPQRTASSTSPATDGKAPADTPIASPPTLLQKLIPFLHLTTVWLLLAYFVVYMEPRKYAELGGSAMGAGLWKRWAELGSSGPATDVAQFLKIQVVPFFWAFTTLQIILHTTRIFSGFDSVQPPTLLALVLPHLPPPLPSIIVNGLKYLQMGSIFLDDLCGLVVGLGFIVLFSGWFSA